MCFKRREKVPLMRGLEGIATELQRETPTVFSPLFLFLFIIPNFGSAYNARLPHVTGTPRKRLAFYPGSGL